MKNFHKNVFRMAVENKGSFLGAAFIIAIGIFIYVAMMDTLKNLQQQIFLYYETSAMADIFANVSGISGTELERLEEIPGIRKASGKIAQDVRIFGSGQEEIVTVHLLSYRANETVNRLALSAPFSSGEELFLGSAMEGVYGYEPGEVLQIIFRGQKYDFTYAGTCQSPDYIYSIPPGGAMIPDGEVYDIACISEERMEEILGRRDCYTELGFLLESGYTYEDVKSRLKEALEVYGLVSICARSDQTSYSMVESEMGELVSVGSILPAIFMAVSVFMLYVVLKKMIDRDQRLIGTMKAFGMTDRELMSGYLAEGAAAGLAGAVIGSILAAPFGSFMFDIYVDFFSLPDTVYHNYWDSRITGAVIAVGTGILAVFWGIRDILSITPAQAMRTKTPGAADRSLIPAAWLGRLDPMKKMALRVVIRNPFRGFLVVLSVAFPFAMSSVLFSFEGVAEQMFLDQFEKIQVYDLQLSLDGFESPVRARQGGEILDGVLEAEAVCRLPVEICNENLTDHAILYGLNPGSDLWKIVDNRGVSYDPPGRGIILNSRTAENLHVKKGDTVRLRSAGITVEAVEAAVEEIIEEGFGSGCYMSMEGLGAAFPVREAANTVLLKAEPGKKEALKDQVREAGRVTWLVDAEKIVGSYRNMMGSMMAMIYMFALLSVSAGGILIYNISMINIRERIAEFGTLMIMGVADSGIRSMLLMEHGLYFAGGILLGFPGSAAIRVLLEKIALSENYSVNLEISPWAYGMAFAICLIMTAVSCLAENSFVRKISLTDTLKERE